MTGWRSMIPGLALAALAGGVAVPARADTVAGWEITHGRGICTMSAVFPGDTTIALIWQPESKTLTFMAGGESVAAAAGKGKAALDLSFKGGNVKYNDWTDQGAKVVERDGTREIYADWGADLSGKLGDTVSGSGSLSLRIGDKDLGSYDLSGAPQAYRELMRCDAGQVADR